MLDRDISLMPPVRYHWCGKFSSESDKWKHMERTLSDEELFLVTEGVLYIAKEGEEYEVKKGEYLIMPPCRHQHGYRPSKCSFYFLHFGVMESADEAQANGRSQKEENMIKRRGKTTSMERVIILLNQLIESARRYHQEYMSDLLCTGVLLEIHNQCTVRKDLLENPTSRLYQGILDYVEWNFKQDITVRGIAEYFGYHEKYLTTVFRRRSGMPLKAYIQKEKMEYAKAELMDTQKPIRQIAEDVGYSDSHNFSNAFCKATGLSPTQYRISCRKVPKTP